MRAAPFPGRTSMRVRISGVMASVAVVALNLGAIRSLFGLRYDIANLLGVGVLPMTNVLAAVALLCRRRPDAIGFVAFGSLALAAFATLAFALTDTMYEAIGVPVR